MPSSRVPNLTRFAFLFQPTARWVIFVGVAMASLVLAFEASRLFVAALEALHDAETVSPSTESGQLVSRAASSARKYVAAWPPGSEDFDTLTRFINRLAHEQQLSVIQLQSEGVRTEPGHLHQLRITLQLRGGYVGSKTLLIALLAKFPGLTLERLTVRHHPGAASAASGNADVQGADDQTMIELIQYSAPTPASA